MCGAVGASSPVSEGARMIEFGTGGWRAIIGDEFTRENVRLLAQGLADRMHAEGVVERGLVSSYDRRFLSDVAAWWAIEVLAGNGIPVRVITRPVPTPMCMWTVQQTGAAYGVAVTASHNPARYDGLKLFTAGARDAHGQAPAALTAHVASLSAEDVPSLAPHEVRDSELVPQKLSLNWYPDAITDQLDLE